METKRIYECSQEKIKDLIDYIESNEILDNNNIERLRMLTYEPIEWLRGYIHASFLNYDILGKDFKNILRMIDDIERDDK